MQSPPTPEPDRNVEKPTVRGRFAPSPTGKLHLGNVRTALLAWLQVRALGGEFLLRIEDLDRARCRPEFVDAMLRDLEYLGLEWDAPPWFQSQRQIVYDEAIALLSVRGQLYGCHCSRAEIARVASAPHGASDDGPRYPGTCADLTAEERAEREQVRPPALRFRVRPGEIEFMDLLHGRYRQDVQREVGDFVVGGRDGVPSYQLAVVVDDAASGITHVLRGDDLLPSTPRQLLLYEAFEEPAPAFLHVPLLVDPDGRRLAKREGATELAYLRDHGVPAEKVLGVLAQWSGLGNGEPVTARALVERFSLARLSREPVTVDVAALERALGLA
jgi:glutamyl-tRNA synthetase